MQSVRSELGSDAAPLTPAQAKRRLREWVQEVETQRANAKSSAKSSMIWWGSAAALALGAAAVMGSGKNAPAIVKKTSGVVFSAAAKAAQLALPMILKSIMQRA